MLNLVRLPERPVDWDELIASYETKCLFHESCWLDHILTSADNYEARYYVIKDGLEVVGYFCAIVTRKVCLNLMGSPLGGTGTNYMGPIVNRSISLEDLVDALVTMNRSEGISHFEIGCDDLDEQAIRAAGFDEHIRTTNKIVLPETEEVAFGNFTSSCRNKIKKAQKGGLVAETADDDSIIDDYLSQMKEVFGKQGMDVPYGRRRVESLLKNLKDKNRIVPLRVKYEDKIIATGFFPHCDDIMYAWGFASFLEYQKLAPNDLMIWAALRIAISKNIKEFNFCGGESAFKSKFGGQDCQARTYSKSYFMPLKYLRSVYQNAHHLKMKAKGYFVAGAYERKKRIG